MLYIILLYEILNSEEHVKDKGYQTTARGFLPIYFDSEQVKRGDHYSWIIQYGI